MVHKMQNAHCMKPMSGQSYCAEDCRTLPGHLNIGLDTGLTHSKDCIFITILQIWSIQSRPWVLTTSRGCLNTKGPMDSFISIIICSCVTPYLRSSWTHKRTSPLIHGSERLALGLLSQQSASHLCGCGRRVLTESRRMCWWTVAPGIHHNNSHIPSGYWPVRMECN